MAGLNADYIIFARAVALGALKDGTADVVFGKGFTGVPEGIFRHIKEKGAEARGALKQQTGGDALGQEPAGIVLNGPVG